MKGKVRFDFRVARVFIPRQKPNRRMYSAGLKMLRIIPHCVEVPIPQYFFKNFSEYVVRCLKRQSLLLKTLRRTNI